LTSALRNQSSVGIAFILAGMLSISLNDLMIKLLSGDYPLHQIVFARSSIGILFTLMLVQFEGGFSILKTRQPALHLLRGVLIVIANMTFFVALAALPLADATALFFAAPLFITLLSIPILGEKVGPLRIIAVAIGFLGVVIMQRPWEGSDALMASRIVLLLPVLSAITYAFNQILTRKLGGTTKASALALYIQATFIVVSVLFYVVAGDGRFAQGSDNSSIQFLLRAWVWPSGNDIWVMVGLGVNSAIIGYCLSQAYRMADAATIAPFEYVGLLLAVFWGWVFWAEIPVWEVWLGMILIMGSGLFVFLREQQKAKKLASAAVNRRY
jgi:S-adenosylmethionine uptake transporter